MYAATIELPVGKSGDTSKQYNVVFASEAEFYSFLRAIRWAGGRVWSPQE